MVLCFGPESFRVHLKWYWGYPYREQGTAGNVKARNNMLIECGVEDSVCSRVYYFVVPFFSFMVSRHDKAYVPKWKLQNDTNQIFKKRAPVRDKADNIIQFPRRRDGKV